MTKAILPPEALSQHIAVLGKTGSGKTSTGKLIIEQVVAQGARVCILDPIKSDWWGMTSSADGKRPGLPFHILGGPRGHVPLHAQAGKAIGEIVATGALPLSIIDMADFGPGDHMRFFCDFAQAMLRKMRGVLYLVMEEAHEFAPKERTGLGAENMGIYWAKKIATGGRSKGIRLIVMTQSVQQLHNRVLGSCETMIAHRLTTPADQKPVIDWLKANAPKDIAASISQGLAGVRTGSGWVCSGELKMFERRDFPRIHTYDNSATPTDDDKAHEVKTAPVDQDKLRSIIGDAVKDAEANDPKKLRARIAELERDAKKGHAAPAAIPATAPKGNAAELKRNLAKTHKALGQAMKFITTIIATDFLGKAGIDQGRLQEAIKAAVENAAKQFDGRLESQQKAFAKWRSDGERMLKNIESVLKDGEVHINVQVRQNEPFTVKTVKSGGQTALPSRPRSGSAPDASLPVGERATLTACAQTPGGCTREQLTILTGYKRSTRDAYIQRLREKGFIEANGGQVTATQQGMDALGSSFEPLPTGNSLRLYWLDRLPEGERKVLNAAILHFPDAISRESIDSETGFKRSTRDAYIQRLKARQLIKVYRDGITAADTLFD